MGMDYMVGNPEQLDGNRLSTQMFAQVFRAYKECSDEIQAAIRDMVDILDDEDATNDEKEAALSTIQEALFPKTHDGNLGIDLEVHEGVVTGETKEVLERMKVQEDTFARALERLLDEKGMTQQDLADAIGVGQPAISMMLNRRCRPQRRTVEKIAGALKVPTSDLWPK